MGKSISYDKDSSSEIDGFDRVAYFLELKSPAAGHQRLFVSMKAFTDDVKKIGIPVAGSKIRFQQKVEDVFVASDVRGIANGEGIKTANIEFWPHNYDAANSARIPGALGGVYDFGDRPTEPLDGYGSMQIHNHGKKQTLFAINHWSQGAGADIGIGNSTGTTRDWTFARNADQYTFKRLSIYVRKK